MNVSVVLERVENNGYRARCAEPIPASAVGETRDEALDRLRTLLADKVAGGLEVVQIRLPTVTPERPLWPDDEVTRLWLEGIEEARRRGDELTYPWEEAAPGNP